jgi:predicted DNA-binding protein
VASVARRTSLSPVKVFDRTRTRLQYAAGLLRKTQAEIMEAAVDEYIEHHIEDFAVGLKEAREALLGGAVATLAHVSGEDPEVVQSVAGDVDPDVFKPRKVERSRTTPVDA